MNRLILIGNGFDLAHGMKTSYNDFILWYIKIGFEEARVYSSFKDSLMTIKRINGYEKEPKGNSILDYKIFLTHTKSKASIIFGNSEDFHEPQNKYSWTIKNPFFQKLVLQCCDLNWVDIENEYYSELLEILKVKRTDNNEINKLLKELNDVFKFLISKLNEYFSKLPAGKINHNMLDVFSGRINKNELSKPLSDAERDLESLMVLNFNYTDTHEMYGKYYMTDYKGGSESNYINGQINVPNNPIIFGFGDEIDENYKKIENDKADGFLKYVKTFAYLRTPNYRRLLNFIELAPYQIFILGHSCGLSDRTLLKMIFEHENCLSIKIFYHQKEDSNNFTELTQAISRNFTDNGLMRKKVVDYTWSSPMPQAKI